VHTHKYMAWRDWKNEITQARMAEITGGIVEDFVVIDPRSSAKVSGKNADTSGQCQAWHRFGFSGRTVCLGGVLQGRVSEHCSTYVYAEQCPCPAP
jgi:hypothetical protein